VAGWSSVRCGEMHGEAKLWVARGVARSSSAWSAFYRRGWREVSGRGRSPVGVEWSPLMATVLQRIGGQAVDL
jgi:hypothetical protein